MRTSTLLRRLLGDKAGVSAIEFAIGAPVLILGVLAMVAPACPRERGWSSTATSAPARRQRCR